MDYVIGSVAALISGNVTPSRPKIARRALTPTKHQASPNVTPKSEFVEDRSIFLSPTQQKKKAIVKKSPKRIFQNPDLDATEGNSSLGSPKAEKVKKHLKEDLDAEDMGKKKSSISKSPSNEVGKSGEFSPKKKPKILDNSQVEKPKKKKRGNSESNVTENASVGVNSDNAKSEVVEISTITKSNIKNSKKKKRKLTDEIQAEDKEAALTHSPKQRENSEASKINSTEGTTQPNNQENKKSKKRKKKNKKPLNVETNTPIENKENTQNATEPQNPNKKKKNRKNKPNKSITEDEPQETEKMDEAKESESEVEDEDDEVKSRNIPNPNAITEKDSDSEHDSDDEIESENEQENEKILTTENQPEESSDEEEPEPSSKKKESINQQKEKEVVMTEAEIKRTLFVGNVLFSSKCKKEVKKIFGKYGQIDTIRIRTIPVKDARVTPKLAIIKNELHPERTTVNVYVKYADPASVNKALAENNTVVNGNHLRVSRSDSTGAEHDPHCAVFVGNLPFAVEDDTLRSKFENCGEITSVRIIRDKKTNAGKGFGYVNFASKDGVELALALSEEDLTIKNRIIRVKRCTVQRPGGSKPSGGKSRSQGQQQRGGNRGNQGQTGKWNNQGQTGQWRNQAQGGGKWGGQGQDRGNRGNQGHAGKWGNQGQGGGKWGGQGQDGGKWGNQGQGRDEGAARRLMNKRKQQDGSSEGPPNKMQKNVNQPIKEKKPRKEFVGMTAEKKKKHKPNKGLKQKKALSEILTKKS